VEVGGELLVTFILDLSGADLKQKNQENGQAGDGQDQKKQPSCRSHALNYIFLAMPDKMVFNDYFAKAEGLTKTLGFIKLSSVAR